MIPWLLRKRDKSAVHKYPAVPPRDTSGGLDPLLRLFPFSCAWPPNDCVMKNKKSKHHPSCRVNDHPCGYTSPLCNSLHRRCIPVVSKAKENDCELFVNGELVLRAIACKD